MFLGQSEIDWARGDWVLTGVQTKQSMQRYLRTGIFVGLLVCAGVIFSTLNKPSPLHLIMPAAGEEIVMAPHKALYDFRMISVQSGTGLNDIRGQMFFEIDDTCDAWTTDHRFITEYHYPERQPLLNSSHYVGWESKDGGLFHFTSEKQQGNEEKDLLRGVVERASDGSARAIYSRPADLSFDLGAGYFLPISHSVELVRRARDGDALFNGILFDGTDADGPVEVNAFIGKKATTEEIEKIAEQNSKIDKALLVPEAWHIRMALFLRDDKKNDSPLYEMDLLMHANGVVSDVVVDYRTFKVRQSLQALETLPPRGCAP